ncbi:DUF3800 domain-containing protein [Albimonas donghaensis]|uniref:DUF3800 domain-containing protein n=1 Tax=Albimonas donghaensis TaxID=356660 RepID=UPI0015A3A956|nr:DUF3800 domain-containing protein [Albimonas donghaensis]
MSTIYADESDDKQRFVLAFVSIPTASISLPSSEWDAEGLNDDWSAYFEKARTWRKALKEAHGIPLSKELKGSKLATGRNRYDRGRGALYGNRAWKAYRDALQGLSFLPDHSIFSVYATRDANLYGRRKLEASLYAAFQRIERQNKADRRRSMLFFDEGHGEYRTLYRKACVHLPTGSRLGAWSSGSLSKNIPMVSTIEDANFKDSKKSHFIQIADLIAYATLLKARHEGDALSERESRNELYKLHDAIPRNVLNARVVTSGTDGIVRLK